MGVFFIAAARLKHKFSIIRILWMVSVYSSVSFLTVLFPQYSAYFKIASDLYATVAVTSLFMLSSAFISPTLHEVKEYFRSVQPKPWQNNVPLMIAWLAKLTGGQDRGVFRRPRSGLTWFNVS
jgi:organic solute transporter Ostalpha